MSRPITIASGQFGDMSVSELAELCEKMGYEGIELATHAHFDVGQALADPSYIPCLKEVLEEHHLKCFAISAHLTGQCVGDEWEPRLDNFVPDHYKGNPDKIRKWAIEEMKHTAEAAAMMGVNVVTGFTGSPLWPYWYSYPQTTEQMIEEGYQKIYDLWMPIFDVFDQYGVRFALEVHPAEIAFDYYSTKELLKRFGHRKTLGINFDPSHLVWQGIDEKQFLHDFREQIYHVHIKDVKVNLNGRNGILGSCLPFGDLRRGWNFVSVGHGDVDFDGIIRELNAIGYDGPLSVEWEDSGMEREYGAKESLEYIRKMNFSPSEIAFDSALQRNRDAVNEV